MGLRDSQHIGRIVIDPHGHRHRLRGGRRPAVGRQQGARRLQDHRRRRHVAARPRHQREHRRHRPDHGSRESEDADRGRLLAAPHRVWLQRRRARLPASTRAPMPAGAGARSPAACRPATSGRIGLDIYRRNSNIVYAIVENRDGGVFRSEDKGETWTKVNSLNPRPMYFSQIRVDPNDSQRIYVNGVNLHISDDGGKTFRDDGSMEVHLGPPRVLDQSRELAAPDRRQRRRRVGEPRSLALVGAPEQLSDRPVLQRRCGHAAAVSHLRRHAGQRVVGRPQLGARPPGHRQRALVSDALVRRHVHRRRSARPQHHLYQLPERPHRPLRPQDRRAQVDHAAGRSGPAAAAVELDRADRRFVARQADALHGRATRVQVARSRTDVGGHQSGSHLQPQSRRDADHGRRRPRRHPVAQRRHVVVRQHHRAGGVTAACRPALWRHRRRQHPGVA